MGDVAAAGRGGSVPVGAGVAGIARRRPDDVALTVDGGPRLSYGAWDRRADAVARGLVARGVRTGHRVALRFDGPSWADFAVAHLAVRRAGGVAVLVSPGAAPADAARAVAHAAAVGVLGPARLAPAVAGVWTATPDEVADAGEEAAPLPPPAGASALAELLYPPSPLARPRPWPRSHADVDAAVQVAGGALVCAWAPGSPGGRFALALAGAGTPVVALARFSAPRLCALLVEREAVACGLSPPLAAALLASGAAHEADTGGVAGLVLSGTARPALRAGLAAAFPAAALVELEGPDGGEPQERAERAGRVGGDAPAAVSQEAMLWHEQFTPGSFNLPCLVRRYEGPLDVGVLSAALADLAERHEPLRSTFDLVDGRPHQVVGPRPAAGLSVADLADLPGAARDAEVARVLAEASARPFDLVDGPLFEPSLLRLGHDDHVLVVRLHHLVFDDWSVDVFRRQLSALYAARLEDAPPPAEPAVRFGEFARRERAFLEGEVGMAQRAWWREELRGAPLAVQLAVAGEGSGAGGGDPVRVDLPPAVSAAVRALAPRLRATPYMTALAAFQVVLARHTGQDDLLIASVVAHRDRSELERLIGCFTKKVPLRLRVDGDPRFPELVARTRAAVLGALAHQDVAFDAVVQESLGAAAAEHGAVPQVNVVFQGETPQRARVVLPGVTTRAFEVPTESRRERHFSAGPDGERPAVAVWGDGLYLRSFLLVSLLDTDEGLSLLARGAFHRPTGRRLLEQLAALLADLTADPDRRVSQLSLGDGAAPLAPAPGPDVVDVRGLRACRSRLEAALASCPGVADVALAVRDDDGRGPRLVAYVVVRHGAAPPTLAELRLAQWRRLPGSLWPAAAVVVDELPRLADRRPDVAVLPPPSAGGRPEHGPDAAALAALWAEVRGAPCPPGGGYWQDFSFLAALAEAREAGLDLHDERVARNRTVATLAADAAADHV